MGYKTKIMTYQVQTKSGPETYYRVQLPKPLIHILGITSEDEVEWSLETRGGELVLLARIVKKSQ
jgi:hypothetical protein